MPARRFLSRSKEPAMSCVIAADGDRRPSCSPKMRRGVIAANIAKLPDLLRA
jgi:hypothetical protein